MGQQPEKLSPLTIVADAWIAVVAALIFTGKQLFKVLTGQEQLDWALAALFGIVLGLGLLLSTTTSGIKWATTKFVVAPDEFRVDSGWLWKSSKRLSYGRIQSVDINQPLAARLIGLVKVTVDAGPDDKTSLAFLTRTRATELRRQLLRETTLDTPNGYGLTATPQVLESYPTPPALPPATQKPAPPTDVLVKIPPKRLFLGLVLSNAVFFWSLLLPILFLANYFLPDWDILSMVFKGGAIAIAGAIGVFAWQSLVPDWNFTLARSEDGLTISKGATDVTSTSVPVHRVQSISIVQPRFWRWIGMYRVKLEVLGTIGESGDSSALLPIGNWAEVEAAIAAIWPEVDLNPERWSRPVPKARWLSPLAFSWFGYASAESVLLVRTGWLWRVTHVTPYARVLGVDVSQSWSDRLTQSAILLISTAGSTIPIFHVPQSDARQLAHDILDRSRDAAPPTPGGNVPVSY